MRHALAVTALLLVACGGAPRASGELRERLRSGAAAGAHERAPELVAQVERALDDADEAERDGDAPATADHVTRARLLFEAAVAEAARVEDETERAHIESEIATILARARRDEAARETISAGLSRRASARAAREEVARALEQASRDEARPLRRRRVSLEEAQDLRRAAAALRARARLAMAAARALAADDEALAEANAALDASDRAENPLGALSHADRAHYAALRALGVARASLEGPGDDGPSTLAEAARAEGLSVVSLPEGLAIEGGGVFNGASASVARRAADTVERLASLIAAHPHGPVLVQAQVAQQGRVGDSLAERRAVALRRALVTRGADEERLTAQPVPTALRGEHPVARVRLVFVAYAPR